MDTLSAKFDKLDLNEHIEASITDKRKKEFSLEMLIASFFSEILRIMFLTGGAKALWNLIKKEGFQTIAILQSKDYMTSELRQGEVGYYIEVVLNNGARITLPDVNFLLDGDLEKPVYDPLTRMVLEFFSGILLVDKEHGVISVAHHHIAGAAEKECLGIIYKLTEKTVDIVRTRPYSGPSLTAQVVGQLNGAREVEKEELISMNAETLDIGETAIYAIHNRIVYRSM